MDLKSQVQGECEYEAASGVSRWLFLWLERLFRLGAKKDLVLSDLTRCCTSDEPTVVTALLEQEWSKELDKFTKSSSQRPYKPSLVRAIIRAVIKRYTISCLLMTMSNMIGLAQPFMIGVIILSLKEQVSNGSSVDSLVIVTAVIFMLSNAVAAFIRHRGNILATRVGNNVRTALTFMILKKALRMSLSSLNQTDVGHIMNVLANDLQRFEEMSWYLTTVFIAPVMILFLVVFTAIYLQVACLGGLIILLLFLIYQLKVGDWFGELREKTASVTDTRVKLMSELISAMKLIKVYCWEKPFSSKVHLIRKEEIKHLKHTYVLKGINLALFFVANRLMLFTSYLIYVLLGNTLDSYTTFVTMSLYDATRIIITFVVPCIIGTGAETLIACDRIANILMMKEQNINIEDAKANGHATGDEKEAAGGKSQVGSIVLDKMNAKWTDKVNFNNLSELSFCVKPGELIIVIGSVGSGKSCLLYTLLNETEITSGSLDLTGDTSYASQEPWVFGGTVRENILLASPMDAERYKRVIEVSCLARDLKMFPAGDETLVGEKGYSLSGGQKARVSLARALYRSADVYLLDDPLSAVDPKVAKHIMDKAIKGFLKDKTVILVTHQLQFLDRADRVLLLHEGHVKSLATHSEMKMNAIDLDKLIKPEERRESLSRRKSSVDKFSIAALTRSKSHSLTVSDDARSEDSFDSIDEEPAKQAPNVAEEQRTSGSLSSKVYWQYFTAGGKPLLLILALLTSVAAQVLYEINDAWLAAWTDFQERRPNSTSGPESLASDLVFHDDTFNIILFCCITVFLFVSGFLRYFFICVVCLESSVALHDLVFRKLLRAPISFYETNPVGRILNRVTRDMGIIDQTIPATLMELLTDALHVMGVVAISCAKQPWLLFAVAVLLVASVPIRRMYIQTARDLQRLDALSRSPVYNHVSSAISGLVTVRSFKLQKQFEDTFNELLVDSVSCRFHVLCAQRAIGLALDLCAAVYIVAVTISILWMGSQLAFSPADAGMVLTLSLQMMGFFQFVIQCSANFETQMVSTERVIEYANVTSEAELEIPSVEAKLHYWPFKGEIEFDRANMSYSDNSPLVLKDVSFVINPEEKIGIVGRTGAGKSSLIAVLFRLNELSKPESPMELSGKIVIDGIDISTLGLHHLRSHISIIPQDPILFSGTIRSNLDPFDSYSDDQIWKALELSNLKQAVKAMEGALYAAVTEGGSNLSLGQRQLLCLSRALLKQNKILVCDEATANVDKTTDELIQQTIKDKFKEYTVITIAHRLNTIIEMDRILVLEAGQVVEFASPYELLMRRDSYFASMVKQTGSEYERQLISLAEKAYKAKNK